MLPMQSQESIARRAERERVARLAAIGRPFAFAPELPEWVRRAQESRLPIKEYAR